MTSAIKMLSCLSALLLSACSASTPEIKSDYCLYYEIVTVSHQDVITDGTAKPILDNNDTWKALCKN